MLNSGTVSVDNFGHFPQSASVAKMIQLPNDVPSTLHEHPQPILEVQNLSFNRSD